MKKKLIDRIFRNLEFLVGKEWVKSRKNALKLVEKMRIRQQQLTIEEAKAEAFAQAKRMRNQRITNNEKR